MKKRIKRALLAVILIYYRIKCKIFYLLYAGDGIGYVMERMPEVFIIPVLRKHGMQIGENCKILRGLTFHRLVEKKSFKNLVIGNNVYIGRNVLIDLASEVIIKDDAALAAYCQVWTHVGDYTYDFTDYHEKILPVQVGKGVLCWSKVVISPGTIIGDYARVAAGSVVTRDVESKCFVGGVPAKFIRKRNI